MSKRRTVTLSDEHWRAIRMRAVADGKKVGEVMEAIIDSAVVAGGPILYGDTPEVWRLRNIAEWVGGTEAGHQAMHAFARELAKQDVADGKPPIYPEGFGLSDE